jgi:asparagine synthetase B (glutamine-hydrolysing)
LSDYLITLSATKNGVLAQALSEIYTKNPPPSQEFHGLWSSLAVTQSHYHGFQPYETEKHLIIVIGGPVLYFRDNDFLVAENSFEATKAIYQRWIVEGEMQWNEDLSGPFTVLLIDKVGHQVTAVTDLMAFIPVYACQKDESLHLGTHIDALAKVAGEHGNFDEVSLADFVLNDVVTYPYTAYRNIRQLAPSSTTTYSKSARAPTVASYWAPYEENPYRNVKEAARALQDGISGYVNRITEKMDSVAQFISAGEDSRALSGMLPERLNRDAYIFLDSMNREGTIAKRVANVYGAKFTAGFRKKTYYLDILPEASKLVGIGHQYTHAHALGFHREFSLSEKKAVFGGFLSDTLLKGHHVRKPRGYGRFPFLPDVVSKSYSPEKLPYYQGIFEDNVTEALQKRKAERFKAVKKFRINSVSEWFHVWPCSMHNDMPNLYATRRLFRSYEPFMCKEAVKISAAVPTSWKLNRRLFNHAMKPYLRKSKWMMHADGRLPYFSWWVNRPLQFSVRAYRYIAKRIGLIRGNQGPWGDWQAASRSPVWMDMKEKYAKHGDDLGFLKEGISTSELLNSSFLPVNNRVNLLQVAYQVSQSRNSGDNGNDQKITRNSDVYV